MSELPTMLLTISRAVGEAAAALRRLDEALKDDDLERARRVLADYVRESGAAVETIRPSPAAVPPSTRADPLGDPEQALRRWMRSFSQLLTEWRLEDAE